HADVNVSIVLRMYTYDIVFFYCRLVPHRDLHSFPTRRSSDLDDQAVGAFGYLARTVDIEVPQADRFEPEDAREVAGVETVCLRRSEEHTSELQSRGHLVCRLLLENKKSINQVHLLQ